MEQIYAEGKRKYYINSLKGKIYITNLLNKKMFCTKDFIDISYESKNIIVKSLSTPFPHDFTFHGIKIRSVEGFLQSLKYKDEQTKQHLINCYGSEACFVGASNFDEDLQYEGNLYFEGKKIDRYDIEYQELLNELYLSLCSNSTFENSLKATGDRELLYSSGIEDPTKTLLTSREFADRLKIIRNAILLDKNPKNRLAELSDKIAEDYYQKNYANN